MRTTGIILAAILIACLGVARSQVPPVWPNFTYFVPAIAENGAPNYVIPGPVTEDTRIGFSVSSVACLQVSSSGAGIDCDNAAGIVVTKGSTAGSNPGDTGVFAGDFGGFPVTYNNGALLMSIEGVGTVQVFAANKLHGLHSSAPPTTLTLAPTSFRALGLTFTGKIRNPHIRFYVADNYYPDNSLGYYISGLQSPSVRYMPATSRKLQQLNGPCDWQTSTLTTNPIVCEPTAASPTPNVGSQVLGSDLGSSFVNSSGNLTFLFGDTIGVQLPLVTPVQQSNEIGQSKAPDCPLPPYPSDTPNCFLDFMGLDAFAIADPNQTDPATFKLNFTPQSLAGTPKKPKFVSPVTLDGNNVDMGGNDVPKAGISINGTDYLVVATGSDNTLTNPHEYSCSLLVQDVGNTTFTAGRTISIGNVPDAGGSSACPPPVQSTTAISLCPSPDSATDCQTGHFVNIALAKLPLAYAQQIGLNEAGVLMVGTGIYHDESIYLSFIPESSFWTGTKNPPEAAVTATEYFTGLNSVTGMPMWSDVEMAAVPVVYDNPLAQTPIPAMPPFATQNPQPYDPGTVGDLSLVYNPKLALWLLTWDGGSGKENPANTPVPSGATKGIYFSSAPAPWGPWSPPQMIFNPCLDSANQQGYGYFMHYGGSNGPCAFMADAPYNLTPPALHSGPEGPIIGTVVDPFFGQASGPNGPVTPATRVGDVYAPYMIRGLTSTDGVTMTIGFTMSTWNPYAAVMMESQFTITPPSY